MFDIGYTEIIFIIAITIFLVRPHEIPFFLQNILQFCRKIQKIISYLHQNMQDIIMNIEIEDFFIEKKSENIKK